MYTASIHRTITLKKNHDACGGACGAAYSDDSGACGCACGSGACVLKWFESVW